MSAETKKNWTDLFRAALTAAAAKAGTSLEGLEFEQCSTDRTWGDRCGMVFFGAPAQVCERAARFFVQWMHRWGRELDIVGGYNRQASIGYEGEMVFTRWSNGAKDWFRLRAGEELPVVGTEHKHSEQFTNRLEEVRTGVAASYVYYPCAE